MSRDESVGTDDFINTDSKLIVPILNISEEVINTTNIQQNNRTNRRYDDLTNPASFNVVVPTVLYSDAKKYKQDNNPNIHVRIIR